MCISLRDAKISFGNLDGIAAGRKRSGAVDTVHVLRHRTALAFAVSLVAQLTHFYVSERQTMYPAPTRLNLIIRCLT